METFVGHSFAEEDIEIAHEFIDYFDSIGIKCKSGEKPKNIQIDEKVKQEIDSCDLFIGIFTKDKRILIEEDKEVFTTSNWVIQESGYAIAKEKELIFLVENDIYKFPQLQGNLELICFDRDNIEKTSRKINYMVNGLKERDGNVVHDEKSDDKLEKSIEKDENISSEELGADIINETVEEEFKEENDVSKLYKELFNTINVEKDHVKVRAIYKQIEPLLEPEKQLSTKAYVLKCCHDLGEINAFEELVQLSRETNDISVLWHLASRYKEMGEYIKAKDIFLDITDLYDWKDKEKWEKIFMRYNEAVDCLIEAKKYKDAIELSMSMLSKDEFEEYKARTFASLAQIYLEKKDFELFYIYAEGSLDLDPLNTDLRFKLALKYSENSYDKISLLHYHKLMKIEANPGTLNNTGVQQNKLKLPGKSVENYFKSAELNNTIAMANIAYLYLEKGFIDDARAMIKKANDLSKEGIEIHGDIGAAKNKLDAILKNEDEKESFILKEADEE
ncbi:MAG: hypothetical protein K8E24_013955, partial [Methanobacterium paludis]|nr:hypothetical protein [Methanobacterium paludis]